MWKVSQIHEVSLNVIVFVNLYIFKGAFQHSQLLRLPLNEKLNSQDKCLSMGSPENIARSTSYSGKHWSPIFQVAENWIEQDMFRWSPHGSLINRDVQLPRWYYFDIVRSQVYSLGGLPFIWIIAVDIFMSSTEMVEKNLRQIWQPLRHRCHCSVFVDTIHHQTSIRTNDCLLCCNSHRFASCTRTHNTYLSGRGSPIYPAALRCSDHQNWHPAEMHSPRTPSRCIREQSLLLRWRGHLLVK